MKKNTLNDDDDIIFFSPQFKLMSMESSFQQQGPWFITDYRGCQLMVPTVDGHAKNEKK